jgi:hypothetical protein
MNPKLAALLLLLSLLGAPACGGTASNVLGADGGSGGSGGGGDPGNTGLAPQSCGSDTASNIQGTWDLVASRSGSAQSGATLVIDANTFSIGAEGSSLEFSVNGGALQLMWRDHFGEVSTVPPRSVPISAAHTSAPFDVGVFPLALGGQWNFASTSDSESCVASLSAAAFNAACTEVHGTPFGTVDGTVVGQRTQTMASVFGDLGGQWHLTSNKGGVADVTFAGNSFSAIVQGQSNVAGAVSVRICDAKVSGITSRGIEFSGIRR